MAPFSPSSVRVYGLFFLVFLEASQCGIALGGLLSPSLLQLSDAMTTQPGRPTWSVRPGRSPTRAGWWWTAPAWGRAAAVSPAPPEVSGGLASAGCSVLFILLIFQICPSKRKGIPFSALLQVTSFRGMAIAWKEVGNRSLWGERGTFAHTGCYLSSGDIWESSRSVLVTEQLDYLGF